MTGQIKLIIRFVLDRFIPNIYVLNFTKNTVWSLIRRRFVTMFVTVPTSVPESVPSENFEQKSLPLRAQKRYTNR